MLKDVSKIFETDDMKLAKKIKDTDDEVDSLYSSINWLDTISASVEDWYGITVENGHVAEIDLPGNNLTGNLPEILTGLTELNTLKLDTNNIGGTIENWIDDLENLENINLVKNQVSGEITSEIGKLFKLKTLKFSSFWITTLLFSVNTCLNSLSCK